MFSSTQTDEQTLAQAQEAAARAGRQFPRPSLSPTHVAATGTGTGPLLSSHHLSIIGSSLSASLTLPLRRLCLYRSFGPCRPYRHRRKHLPPSLQ